MVKKFLLLLPLVPFALFMTGCASTTITNLTAHSQSRNTNNLYMIEAKLDSRQQTLRWETLRPMVVVDTESYPMRPTALMTNRWEAIVPIPAGKSVIFYRFRFDYEYNAFGSPPKTDSKLSSAYRLQILDK